MFTIKDINEKKKNQNSDENVKDAKNSKSTFPSINNEKQAEIISENKINKFINEYLSTKLEKQKNKYTELKKKYKEYKNSKKSEPIKIKDQQNQQKQEIKEEKPQQSRYISRIGGTPISFSII